MQTGKRSPAALWEPKPAKESLAEVRTRKPNRRFDDDSSSDTPGHTVSKRGRIDASRNEEGGILNGLSGSGEQATQEMAVDVRPSTSEDLFPDLDDDLDDSGFGMSENSRTPTPNTSASQGN